MWRGLSVYVVIVSVTFLQLSKAALPNQCADGTNTCPANSACDNDNDICVCNDDHKLNVAQDGCEPKVLGDECTADTDCAAVENTKCDIDGNNDCVCDDAHKQEGDACTAKGLMDTCTQDADCQGVTMAECTDGVCGCSPNYTAEGNVCKKALGQTCATDAECVTNAVCDTTDGCSCETDYIVENGLCTQPSSAKSIKLNGILFVVSLLLLGVAKRLNEDE